MKRDYIIKGNTSSIAGMYHGSNEYLGLIKDDKVLQFSGFDVPEGDDSVDYSKEYFTIFPLNNGTITLSGAPYASKTLYYSNDKSNWTSIAITASTSTQTYTIPAKRRTPVYLKASGVFSHRTSDEGTKRTVSIKCDADYYVRGNLSTWLSSTLTTSSVNYTAAYLFQNDTHLLGSKYLYIPAPSATYAKWYGVMFQSCTNMKTAPKSFPTPTGSGGLYAVYTYIFCNCDSLVDLHETLIGTVGMQCIDWSWSGPFINCDNLEYGPRIMETGEMKSGGESAGVFYNCPKLKWIFDMHTSINSAVKSKYQNTSVTNGIFVRNYNVTSSLGVEPSGWKIIYYNTSNGKYYLSDRSTVCDWQGNVI